MSELEQLYDAVSDVTEELRQAQPWLPCWNCPVAQTVDNCCHKAMFHVSFTEWMYLREHPFIQNNLMELVLSARNTIKRLRAQGWDTKDWASTIAHFSQGGCFTCPLLGDDGRCNVYDRRPLICRTYGVSHPTQNGEVFGCSVVTDAIAEHVGEHVQFVPLNEVTAYAQTILYKPTKPIVAWLAGEQL